MTDDAFAMAHEYLAAAIEKMARSQPGLAAGEIDVVDYHTDFVWELLRTEIGLPFAHPVSSSLYEFITTVASMNVTFEGRGERTALVADGSLGRALAEVKEAAALTPEYAAVIIAAAAGPFDRLAQRHRFM